MVCASGGVYGGWGCYGTLISGTSTSFGSGETNTAAIIAGCTDTTNVAYLCAHYSFGGYTDWYLPSLDEFTLIHNNLSLFGYGGLCYFDIGLYISEECWTSSEGDASSAYYYDLIGNPSADGKDHIYDARPIRHF